MLKFLSIRNFVIVSSLELDFGNGFTALTGETGAGKSILLDALSLTLGDRADSNMVRAGSERAEIIAEFDIAELQAAQQWLSQQMLDGELGECVLRRVLDNNGRSRAFINGSTVTVQQLKELGEMLLNIHGQHAHQTLLRQDSQRELLDAYAGLSNDCKTLAKLYHDWQDAKKHFQQAQKNAESSMAERELLEFQKTELSALQFNLADWVNLQEDYARASNASSLLENASFGIALLEESEQSCLDQLKQLNNRLQDAASYDSSINEILSMLNSAQTELQEVLYALRSYQQKLDIDPRLIQEQEQKIQAIVDAARKHRVTPEQLNEVMDGIIARLEVLATTADLDKLGQQEQKAKQSFLQIAQQLSVKREQAALVLSEEITTAMQKLSMAGGSFKVTLNQLKEGNAAGLEQIEFLVATNPGVPARSIAKVASGGELSRISLAIQVATSQVAKVPTLIFDEVDTGIGGSVAEIVGQMLKQLGKHYQVLCVTHLPQVAASADQQWQVCKQVEHGMTISQISPLTPEQRIEEIARMLGGIQLTDTTRKHAAEMLGLN